MAKDPAFLFYPGDYLRDTQCLSANSQTAYDRIMCEHMRNICISQQQLNFFTKRLSPDEKDELIMVLTKVEAGYQIDWVVDSITKRKAYSDSRSKNRAGKSKEDMNDISKTYDNHMEIENEIVIEDKNLIKIENSNKIDFEIFWAAYDKKVGSKDKLKKKWYALKVEEQEDAIAYIPHYKIAQPDKQYRKNPETFLNNKSWHDEIVMGGKTGVSELVKMAVARQGANEYFEQQIKDFEKNQQL